MKKFLLALFVFGTGFLASTQSAQAYCLVSTEDSRAGNIYGLPRMVRINYNQNLCANSAGSLDRWLGFNQTIRFATQEAGWLNNVNEITLRSSLTFNNDAQNVVVGNFNYDLPETSDYDYVYPINYHPEKVLTRTDYGTVIINGRDLGSGVSPLQCVAKTKNVILRKLIIETNGVTRSEFFDINSQTTGCFRDGGEVYVCTGDVADPTNPAGDSDCVEEEACEETPAACNDDIDNDCDDSTDEADEEEVCEEVPEDIDGDGHTVAEGDCNDEEELIYPGADEACDGFDNNCNDVIDEDDPDVGAACSVGTGACENTGTRVCSADGTVCGALAGAPATEICGNGIDEDCNGADLICDVTPPGGTETGYCADGVDNDNDGDIDCTDSDCGADPVCSGQPPEPPTGTESICTDGIDNEDDGEIDCADPDCFADPACVGSQDSETICDDLEDNDLDGTIDCSDGDCVTAANCADTDPDNVDNDGDGQTENAGDCNDDDIGIYPGAEEVCDDDIDQDCDGLADEGCVITAGDLKDDDDGDGYCEDAVACNEADPPLLPGDCDDTVETTYPEAPEYCGDEVDSDCDGVDEIALDNPTPVVADGDESDGDDDLSSEEAETIYLARLQVAGGDGPEVPDPEDLNLEPVCIEGERPPDDNKGSDGGGCGCDLTGRSIPLAQGLMLMLLALLPIGFSSILRSKKSE